MILPILTYPNKILRIEGKDISFPLSVDVSKLIKNMVDTVKSANGIGLAAPQIGRSLNLIVVNLEHLGVPIFALINPKITKVSKKKTEMEEGCLSIPNVYGMVARPEKVSVSGLSIDGKKIAFETDGLLSKVLQHEIDHTKGILIIDKIKKYTTGKDKLKEMELL